MDCNPSLTFYCSICFNVFSNCFLFLLNLSFYIQGEETVDVATHVLQFVYLGNNGFRFPFAHYPTTEVDPGSLYTNFWKAVGWLRMIGFQVNYCCMDGGEANRSFIKMHFQGKDPEEEKFTTINPYTRKPMVFLLDPSVSKF